MGLLRNLLWIVPVLVLVACGEAKERDITNTNSNSELSNTRAAGEQLYSRNCASCHGSLAEGRMKNRSARDIVAAIRSISSMMYLKSLSSEDIANIAEALSPLPDTKAPPVPRGMTATATGPNAIALRWEASVDDSVGSGTRGYKIFRGAVQIADVDADVLSYDDENLTPVTTYTYSALAYDVAGNSSEKCEAVSATTPVEPPTPDTTPPSVPAGLATTANTARMVAIRWNASTDNTGGSGLRNYRLFRNDTLLATLGPSVLTYNDNAVMPSTDYSYRVSAIDNSMNESARSATLAVRTPAFDGTALYTNRCQNCHGALNISDVRNTTAAAISTAIGTATVPGTVGQMAGLRDLSMNELAAIAAVLSDANDTVAPTVPGAATLASSNFDRVTITWGRSTDAASGMKGYNIYRNGTQIHFANSAVPPTNTQTYTDIGLTERTLYRYKVDAVDMANNKSAMTAEVSITTGERPPTPDTTPPGVPTGLAGTSTANSVTLTWVKPADNVGVTSFKVYRGTTALPTVNVPAVTITDSNLVPSTTYSYTVEAYDAANNKSAKSTAFSIATKTPNGAALYGQRCQGCHGTLDVSDLKFRAPTVPLFANLFANAIAPVAQGGITAMQGRGMPALELNAILALLAGEEGENPTPSPNSVYTYTAPVGNRSLTSSYLFRIFVNFNATTGRGATTLDEANRLIILGRIAGNGAALGGGCTLYDGTSCSATSATAPIFALAPSAPSSNAARAGYLINVCSQLLEGTQGISVALSRAALTTTSPLNTANLTAFHKVFNVNQAPNSATLTALAGIATDASTKNQTLTDAWKAVALPLCENGALGGL